MPTKSSSQKTKLLLIHDVEDLGRSGEVVDVKPGFARNYLLPQGFAVNADTYTLRMQQKLKEEREKQAAVDRKESEEIAKSLEGVVLSTVVKVDQEGHMFGSVSQLDIIKLLKDERGIELTKKMVKLPHPIKTTGVHDIELKLKEDVPVTIALKVVPDRIIEEHMSDDVVKPIASVQEEGESTEATSEEKNA